MKNFAVFKGATGGLADHGLFPGRDVLIDGVPLRAAVLDLEAAPDGAEELGPRDVRVRVDAFSCNYRDKAFLVRLATAPAGRYFVAGSEFVGHVVATGPEVTTLQVGDRVISNHHYTASGWDPDGAPEGIISNHASREYQVHHENKLVPIPASMTDAEAAAFSLGAQTAYGMTRRMALEPGARALVTAARSNTSLFIIQALAASGVEVTATTTSGKDAHRLRDAGAHHVLVGISENGERGRGVLNALEALREEHTGFDGVFDPFFDVHLTTAITLLAPFGKYITCGFAGQTEGAARTAALESKPIESVMAQAMMLNLTLMGNCIGLRDDLERAVRDFEAGKLRAFVDSVYGGREAAAFLERTYASAARFGKVVFSYS